MGITLQIFKVHNFENEKYLSSNLNIMTINSAMRPLQHRFRMKPFVNLCLESMLLFLYVFLCEPRVILKLSPSLVCLLTLKLQYYQPYKAFSLVSTRQNLTTTNFLFVGVGILRHSRQLCLDRIQQQLGLEFNPNDKTVGCYYSVAVVSIMMGIKTSLVAECFTLILDDFSANLLSYFDYSF